MHETGADKEKESDEAASTSTSPGPGPSAQVPPEPPSVRLVHKEEFEAHFGRRNNFPEKRTFKKLREAERYSLENGCVPVFAHQPSADAWRQYLVAGYHGIWDVVRDTRDPSLVAYHEILYGPCHFYLDADFCRHLNPDLDPEEMVERIRHYVRKAYQKYLSVIPTDEDMHGATATNDRKFSYHLTVRPLAKRFVFESRATCAAFARAVEHLAGQDPSYLPPSGAGPGTSDAVARDLSVRVRVPAAKKKPDPNAPAEAEGEDQREETKTACVFDMTVYNRSHPLRTMYSVKREEAAYRPILPHLPATARGPPSVMTSDREGWSKARFLNSMIAYHPTMSPIDYVVIATPADEATGGGSAFSKIVLPRAKRDPAVAAGGVPKGAGWSRSRIRAAPGDPSGPAPDDGDRDPDRDQDVTYEGVMIIGPDLRPIGRTAAVRSAHGGRHDYDPSVPGFAARVAEEVLHRKHGVPHPITPMYDRERQEITFATRHTGCAIAGRSHGGATCPRGGGRPCTVRSTGNHVYYKMYLLHGYLIQFCHSPACAGKRSDRIYLPARLMAEVRKHNEDCDSGMERLSEGFGGVLRACAAPPKRGTSANPIPV